MREDESCLTALVGVREATFRGAPTIEAEIRASPRQNEMPRNGGPDRRRVNVSMASEHSPNRSYRSEVASRPITGESEVLAGMPVESSAASRGGHSSAQQIEPHSCSRQRSTRHRPARADTESCLG
jgi:hypothetical protein